MLLFELSFFLHVFVISMSLPLVGVELVRSLGFYDFFKNVT